MDRAAVEVEAQDIHHSSLSSSGSVRGTSLGKAQLLKRQNMGLQEKP
jgi:hypothetical protein